ncbi:hypothetical protein FACS1894155_07020 [Bacteroidia bacterium]|nr:hypothetical protein FACS1894155_07020 [Bacteroidia bacterium]
MDSAGNPARRRAVSLPAHAQTKTVRGYLKTENGYLVDDMTKNGGNLSTQGWYWNASNATLTIKENVATENRESDILTIVTAKS